MGAHFTKSYVQPVSRKDYPVGAGSPLMTNTPLLEVNRLYTKKSGDELLDIEWLQRGTIPSWFIVHPELPTLPWAQLDEYDPNVHRRDRSNPELPAPIAYTIDEIYEPSFRDIFGYSTPMRSNEDAQILVETSLTNIRTLKNQINAYNLKITNIINKWYVKDPEREHIGAPVRNADGSRSFASTVSGENKLNETNFSEKIRLYRGTPIIINSEEYHNRLGQHYSLLGSYHNIRFIDPKNVHQQQPASYNGGAADNNLSELRNTVGLTYPLTSFTKSELMRGGWQYDPQLKSEMGWSNPKYLHRQTNFILEDFNNMDEELMPVVNELIASIANLIQQNKNIALGCRHVFQNINKGTPKQQKNTANILMKLGGIGLDAVEITNEIIYKTQHEKVNAFIPIFDKYMIILQLVYEWEWFADGWMHNSQNSPFFSQWKSFTGVNEYLPVEDMNKIEPLIRNELHAFSPVPPPAGTNNSNWVKDWVSSSHRGAGTGGYIDDISAATIKSGSKLALKHGLTTTASILGGAVGSVLGLAVGAGIGIAAGYVVDLFSGLFGGGRKTYDRNWFKREIVQKYMELKVEHIASENKFNLIVGFYKQLNQEMTNNKARQELMSEYLEAAQQKINDPAAVIDTGEIEGETPDLSELQNKLNALLKKIENVSTQKDIASITESITSLTIKINNIPDYSDNLTSIESKLAGIQGVLASVSTQDQLESAKLAINTNINELETTITNAMDELKESILGGQQEIKTKIDDVQTGIGGVQMGIGGVQMGIDDVQMGIGGVQMGIDDVEMGVGRVEMGIGDVKQDVTIINSRIELLMSQLEELKNKEAVAGDMNTNPEILEALKKNQRILLEQIKQLENEKQEITIKTDSSRRRRRRRDYDRPQVIVSQPSVPVVQQPIVQQPIVQQPIVPQQPIIESEEETDDFNINKVMLFALPSIAIIGIIFIMMQRMNKKK
jgi:hypothetical protein